MLINRFDGGLNTKFASTHINQNESVICENVDYSSLTIKPTRNDEILGIYSDRDKSFIYFKGQYFIIKDYGTEFIEFDNKVYYYDEGIFKKSDGITESIVGLDAPTGKLTLQDADIVEISIYENYPSGFYVLGISAGDTLSYRILYKTDEGRYGYIDQSYTVLETGKAVYIYPHIYPSNLVEFDVYRKFNGSYRYVDSWEIGGVVEDYYVNIGGHAEYIEPAFTMKNRSYYYTYYRDTDGTESAPNTLAEITDVLKSVAISGFVASPDTSVTHYRLYRIGDDLVNPTLVEEIVTGTTAYTDFYADIDIAENGVITTEGIIKPPPNLANLTIHNVSAFGSDDNIVKFSEVGDVETWNPFYFFTMEDTVTGLASTQNGLLVFLKNKTYIVTGNDPSNYTKTLISSSQGCVNHNSIQFCDKFTVWLSLDGICASTGADVSVISEPKLGKISLIPNDSVYFEQQYYLFHSTGTLVMDIRTGSAKFNTRSLLVLSAYYSVYEDCVYILKQQVTGITKLNTGSSLDQFRYKTGKIPVTMLTEVKIFKNIYIYITGSITVDIYMDGKLVVDDKPLKQGLNDIKLPNAELRAYYVEFDFVGTGEILEIEFKVSPRQNGR